jgi:hypothetical protein
MRPALRPVRVRRKEQGSLPMMALWMEQWTEQVRLRALLRS